MNDSTILIIAITALGVFFMYCVKTIVLKLIDYKIQSAKQQKVEWKSTDNFAATLTEKHIKFNTFIVHPVECKCQWEEFKACIEQFHEYKVFPDNDAGDECDVKYCIDNICSSSLIIILVDNCYRFNSKGVFWKEIKFISEGLARGKKIYICSFGSSNPLEDAIKKCDKERQSILSRLCDEIKTHAFANDSIAELASQVINAHKQI